MREVSSNSGNDPARTDCVPEPGSRVSRPAGGARRPRLVLVGELPPEYAGLLAQQFPGIETSTEAELTDSERPDAMLAWTYDMPRLVRILEAGVAPYRLHMKSAGIARRVAEILAASPNTVLTNGSGAHAPAIAEYVVVALDVFEQEPLPVSRHCGR